MTAPSNSANTRSSTQPPVKNLNTPASTAQPPQVVGVRGIPGVQNFSPTLTVEWQALAGGAVTYTVKYSTQPEEVNTSPEGALVVRGISGTSTILTALERGTTYYLWVVGVSEGGEGPHSHRMSGETFDSPVGIYVYCAYLATYVVASVHVIGTHLNTHLTKVAHCHLACLKRCMAEIHGSPTI